MRIRATKPRKAGSSESITITAGGRTANLEDVQAVIGAMTDTIREATAPPPIKTKRYLRHDFTEPEMLDMGKRLAQTAERVATLNAELDDIKLAFKSKIGAAENLAASLSQSINKGYEMRDTECVVTFHQPAVGQKTTSRLDTGAVVEVEKMDAHEMQERLPLNDAAESDRGD
jgi:hypothetical protein